VTRLHLIGTAAFLILSGCAHSQSAAPAAKPAAAEQAPVPGGDMMSMCPMNVPGTQVSAADSETGETLTFTTTTTDQVAELRSRVHAMAEMHNRHHAAGGMMEGGMAGGTGGMMGSGEATGPAMMPPSHATVVDLEGGASIMLTPNDPADLQKLQSEARVHAQRMQQGGCGMMGQPKGS